MALHSGQSQRACNTTGMANSLRNRESENIYESIGFAAALDAITISRSRYGSPYHMSARSQEAS